MLKRPLNRSPYARRKKILTLSTLLGLLGLALLIFAYSTFFIPRTQTFTVEVPDAPSLRTRQQSIDYGDRAINTLVEVELELWNAGGKNLVLSEEPYIEVVDGCCPSIPKIGKMVLKPGESTTITFPMNMHEGMGGAHDFRVHVLSNDPQNPDFQFTVLSNWLD